MIWRELRFAYQMCLLKSAVLTATLGANAEVGLERFHCAFARLYFRLLTFGWAEDQFAAQFHRFLQVWHRRITGWVTGKLQL